VLRTHSCCQCLILLVGEVGATRWASPRPQKGFAMHSNNQQLPELTETDWWRRYQNTAQELAEDEPTVERRVLDTIDKAIELCLN